MGYLLTYHVLYFYGHCNSFYFDILRRDVWPDSIPELLIYSLPRCQAGFHGRITNILPARCQAGFHGGITNILLAEMSGPIQLRNY